MEGFVKLYMKNCPFCGRAFFHFNNYSKTYCSVFCKNTLHENVKYKRFGTITVPSKMNFPAHEDEVGELIKKLL